jgi:cytochrome c peroxidase
MKKEFLFLLCVTAAIISACGGSGKKNETALNASVTVDPASLQAFQPLPDSMPSDSNPITEEKIALGRMLYYETRLSRSQQISCNTCHMLDKYGVDGEPTSDGHRGQKGDRNSPTVYNAAGAFVQFWDGRAADVEEQAKGPVTNPAEMAMTSEKHVVAVLKSMPEYVEAFKKAFPVEKDPVTYQNMANAIGAFERKLVTPSRWDKYLQGDAQALTNNEKAGFNVFAQVGCQVCHAGVHVGGGMYQKLGVVKAYPDSSDPGRQKVTQKEADRMVFKVPGLRNVAQTGPYYHSGKVGTLEQAVSMMAQYQLGKNLDENQTQAIVAWLNALTGEIPAEYVKPPVLPQSTKTTPKPDLE